MIKLAKLPERTPVKMTIHLAPELADALGRYAALYRESYGREEALADLIPAIAAAFIDGDREFQRRFRDVTKS